MFHLPSLCNHDFPSSSSPDASHLPSHPTVCPFSSFFQNTKHWRNTETKMRTSKDYKNKIKSTHKKIKFVVCWRTTPGPGTFSELWWIYLVGLRWFSCCQQVSATHSFLVREKSLCPLCPQQWVSARALCVLHHLCDFFLCASVLSWKYSLLGIIHHFWLAVLFSST